jgi:hypothetical protein
MERLKVLEAGKYEPWVQEEWMKGTGCIGMVKNSVGLRPCHASPWEGTRRGVHVEEARIKVK